MSHDLQVLVIHIYKDAVLGSVTDFGEEDEELGFFGSITEGAIIFNTVGFREIVPVVGIEVFDFKDYDGAFFKFFGLH